MIELLVATIMLSMLAAAGYAALSTGTSSAAKVKRYNAMMAHGQAALQRITIDIRAAVVHEEFTMISLDTQSEGKNSDTLDFIVALPAKLRSEEEEDGRSGGRCEVGYYIENDPDTEIKWLLRREDGSLDKDFLEGGAITLAGPFVSELNFSFYDGLFWQDAWNDPEEFPEAVNVSIMVVDEDEIENPMAFSTTVPIMAR